jgi:hypothetical protein
LVTHRESLLRILQIQTLTEIGAKRGSLEKIMKSNVIKEYQREKKNKKRSGGGGGVCGPSKLGPEINGK